MHVRVIVKECATRTKANWPALILIQSSAEERGSVNVCVFLSIITALSDSCIEGIKKKRKEKNEDMPGNIRIRIW